ncbi:MAG: nodulation protein NfeD [Anaerolineae bacterium]|nr:nodulation protein NfeD [Anaerolineae bacterium]
MSRSCRAAAVGVALVAVLAGLALPAAAQGPLQPVRVLEVRGLINPLVAQYVERNLSRPDAALYVLLLDTPGGTDTSMRRVVQAILGAPVPVVVYVAPQGARAGSAGMFLLLAAHVAAMAPGTNVGAAHPVGAGGEDIEGALGTKVTNDAATFARSLAETRGRNADWAEEAVRSSLSVTSQEAVSMGVADLLATDLEDLLQQLDGRRVTTAAGEVVFDLGFLPRERVSMTLSERFLHVLIDPNIAYLLMSIGMLAIMVELYHPGIGAPGVVGAICLILAFIAFENLPLNWGGVALIVLALVLFVLDIKVSGYVLSIGGAIAFVLGSLILFSPVGPRSPTMPAVRVSPWLIGTMTAATAGLFLVALSAGVRAQRLPVLVGSHTVIGAKGAAVSALEPVGVVQVAGEQWTARAEGGSIAAGEAVEVVALEGNRLIVRRVQGS